MSYRRLAEAFLQGQPYFGPALRSLQGPPIRQGYFLPIVEAVASTGDVDILEIGSWAGASAISWAAALKKLGLNGHVTCVDPWLPYFDLVKNQASHYARMNRAAENGMIYKLFQHNVSSSGYADTIVAKVGKSSKVLPKMASVSFDIVYIDGSHTLEDASFDIREAKRLVRPGGIICGDDLELQLKDLDAEEVNSAASSGQDYVFSSKRLTHYHPGITLAVAQELGEVCTWDGFWAVKSSAEGWSMITLDPASFELPEHVESAAIKIVADTPTYRLVSAENRYFALAKQLGPPDVAAEFLGDEDLPPLIFTGKTISEVGKKVRHHQEAQEEPALHSSPQIVGIYRGFNVVGYKGSIYGLRQSLGDVDVTGGPAMMTALYDDKDAVIGDSIDGVKARIDVAEIQRKMTALTREVHALGGGASGMQHGAVDDQKAVLLGVIENSAKDEAQVTAIRAENAETARRLEESLGTLRADMGGLTASLNKLQLELVEAIGEVRTLKCEFAESQASTVVDQQAPQLVEWYREFKLVRHGARVYGIRGTLGEVDVLLGDSLLEVRYNGEDVIISDSPDGARTRIDAIEVERAVQHLETRLRDLEKYGVKA